MKKLAVVVAVSAVAGAALAVHRAWIWVLEAQPPGRTGNFALEVLTMAGGWASAFATFAAVGVAFWATHHAAAHADRQRALAAEETDKQRRLAAEEVERHRTVADVTLDIEHLQVVDRNYHRALAVMNDLMGRVHYQCTMMTEGGRPLAALLRNMAGISRRYEALYDRELYADLPGPISNMITRISPNVVGLEARTDVVSASLGGQVNVQVPANLAAGQIFERLQAELVELDEALRTRQEEIQQRWQSLVAWKENSGAEVHASAEAKHAPIAPL